MGTTIELGSCLTEWIIFDASQVGRFIRSWSSIWNYDWVMRSVVRECRWVTDTTFSVSFWIAYALLETVTGSLQWRVPMAFQLVPSGVRYNEHE